MVLHEREYNPYFQTLPFMSVLREGTQYQHHQPEDTQMPMRVCIGFGWIVSKDVQKQKYNTCTMYAGTFYISMGKARQTCI